MRGWGKAFFESCPKIIASFLITLAPQPSTWGRNESKHSTGTKKLVSSESSTTSTVFRSTRAKYILDIVMNSNSNSLNSKANVKEHATPLAGTGVETGIEVHAAGDSADMAASEGCCASPCWPFSFEGSWSVQGAHQSTL